VGQEHIAVVAIVFLERDNGQQTARQGAHADTYRHGGREDQRSEWAEFEKWLPWVFEVSSARGISKFTEGMDTSSAGIQEPFDLIRLSLNERVFVKLRGDRELTGVLHVRPSHDRSRSRLTLRYQAYDGHMNLIMSAVEETIMIIEPVEGAPQGQGSVNVSHVCLIFGLVFTRNSPACQTEDGYVVRERRRCDSRESSAAASPCRC
jgi:U6 snRNA-associated Sm-like protein LSm3